MTRSSFVSWLNRRVGPWAALADPDDAAAYALRTFNLAVADPAAVADADLARVTAALENGVRDVAEWRALESVLNNLTPDELRKVGVAADPAAVSSLLRQRVDRLYARIRSTYKVGLPRLRIGVVTLGTTQRDDPAAVNY